MIILDASIIRQFIVLLLLSVGGLCVQARAVAPDELRSFADVPATAPAGDPIRLSRNDAATRQRILERMAHYKVPGMGIAIVQDNAIVVARGYGVVTRGGRPVTAETRFQAASISKPVSAFAAMLLVKEGKLSLDDDLNKYLVSWKIKSNALTASHPVTLRQILSHTAGFNVHGFAGYPADDRLPSLLQILNGSEPARSPAIVVEAEPGTRFAYSGGGIMVMQQAIVDVTHQPFASFMESAVLAPLKMNDSTYEPLPENWRGLAAVAHQNGKPIPGKWHTYPEQAAAGLWTTPSDLARFAMALAQAARGEKGTLLPRELAKQMLTVQHGGWALGIKAAGAGPSLRFMHNGQNAGFLCMMIGYVQSGQGMVVMINNDSDKAGSLMFEMIQAARAEYAWPAN